MDISALDLSGGSKPPGKCSRKLESLPPIKIQPKQKVLHVKIKDLRECDYVDPPRYQGLWDTPSRTYKSTPQRLGQRETRNLSYLTNSEEYVGPLDREMTFVITTYQFAMRKWQRCHKNTAMFDNEAAGQLWGIQALVCRQRRWVTGRDIAHLLLSDPLTFESRKPLASGCGPQALVNVIVSGKEEEAEQLAKAEGLLDHWVILKSLAKGSCDSVIMRLIDLLKSSDPMKTYFQLLVGKFPTAVAQCGDKNWGDWRPHLAIVLCKADTCSLKKDIMTKMTKTLELAGKVNSAYLCDLIMNLNCGIFLESSRSHLDKIRSPCSSPYQQCSRAALERIQVYKYIMALKPDQPFSSDSQLYKILFSRMLLKAGYIKEAGRFCHSVGLALYRSKDANYATLVEYIKLCSEFPVKNLTWMGWFKETAQEMLSKKSKPKEPSESAIDPQVDAIMPSADTVEKHVIHSHKRHLPSSVLMTSPCETKNLSYLTNCEEYLGPLDQEMTFVTTTYHFAMEKWQRCHENTSMLDNEAAGQLWGIQALVCRQTRWVTGRDIAHLLLSDPLTFAYRKPLASGCGLQALVNVIVSGKEEKAEQLARAEGLLDHWVILKSLAMGLYDSDTMGRIDRLKSNDPMKTYFQLLVGKFPTAASQCGKNNWGDWRPHLAMILCKADKCSLKKEIMTKMTKTLGSAGKANSAYLCDLIMKLNCGIFLESSRSHLDKIRSPCSSPYQQCSRAALERIQVYKYIMALKPDQPFSSDSQLYKILFSRMLFKAGYMKEAGQFCHSVGLSLHHSKDADYATLVEYIKLCSEFPVKNVPWMRWFKETAQEMLRKKPKPKEPSESAIDPQVDAVLPSPDTVAKHVTQSQERHLHQKKHYVTPGPPKAKEKKKKKSTGCFGWLSCFCCFCFCRKKKR